MRRMIAPLLALPFLWIVHPARAQAPGAAAGQASPPPAAAAPTAAVSPATTANAAQPATPAHAPAPTPAPSPATRTIQGVRNKISAGDLRSAESIVEVHREKFGRDGYYIQALGWLARGALLLDEYDRADRYEAELREACADRLRRGANIAKDDSLELALGAGIEVRAQLLARSHGKQAAVEYLDRELTTLPEPMTLRARIEKRRNMLAMAGTPAPELIVEDQTGAPPPSLESLRGRPVIIYLWSWSCGDCRAQAASLARIKARYAGRGLEVIALTRLTGHDPLVEKAKIDSTWADTYKAMGPTPIVISTASAERYGGSSTPTFIFIDRAGLVRSYTPTRLTEDDLDKAVEELLR